MLNSEFLISTAPDTPRVGLGRCLGACATRVDPIGIVLGLRSFDALCGPHAKGGSLAPHFEHGSDSGPTQQVTTEQCMNLGNARC